MKAKIKIIEHIEEAIRRLHEIKAGMDRMIGEEIQLAKKIHLQLSDIQKRGGLPSSHRAAHSVGTMVSATHDIIAQCQMHDILSQRIEHVMYLQEQLRAELTHQKCPEQYSRVLPDILKLNIWQTTDVQKLWAMNIKLIIDHWQMIASSCRMMEREPSVYAGQNSPCHALRLAGHHSTLKSNPHYDQLFMSPYWQELENSYRALHRLVQQENFSINAEERLSILKEVEKCYTMKIERDLLLRLLEENGLLTEEEIISGPKDNDGFAELF